MPVRLLVVDVPLNINDSDSLIASLPHLDKSAIVDSHVLPKIDHKSTKKGLILLNIASGEEQLMDLDQNTHQFDLDLEDGWVDVQPNCDELHEHLVEEYHMGLAPVVQIMEWVKSILTVIKAAASPLLKSLWSFLQWISTLQKAEVAQTLRFVRGTVGPALAQKLMPLLPAAASIDEITLVAQAVLRDTPLQRALDGLRGFTDIFGQIMIWTGVAMSMIEAGFAIGVAHKARCLHSSISYNALKPLDSFVHLINATDNLADNLPSPQLREYQHEYLVLAATIARKQAVSDANKFINDSVPLVQPIQEHRNAPAKLGWRFLTDFVGVLAPFFTGFAPASIINACAIAVRWFAERVTLYAEKKILTVTQTMKELVDEVSTVNDIFWNPSVNTRRDYSTALKEDLEKWQDLTAKALEATELGVWDFFRTVGNDIWAQIIQAKDWICQLIKSGFDFVKLCINDPQAALEAFINFAQGLWDQALAAVGVLVNSVAAKIPESVKAPIRQTVEVVTKIAEAGVQIVKNVVNTLRDWIYRFYSFWWR